MKVPKKGIDYLSRLAAESRLEPEVIVADASHKRHPLHGFFDWNDASAGHKYRVDQARTLIRSVRVELVIEKKTIRAPKYVHDPKGGRRPGYVEVASFRKDEESRREIVLHELKQAVSHLRRANEIAAVLGLQDEMTELIAMASSVLEEVEARAAA